MIWHVPESANRRRVSRVAAIAVLVVLALLVAGQLLLPPYLESRTEDRLTAHGGRASVSLEALPAFRLLFEDGEKLAVEARGLRLDPRNGESLRFDRVFEELDGFDEVELHVADARLGPMAVRAFSLTRPPERETYRFRARAVTSARALYRYAASRVSGSLGPLVAGAADSLLSAEARPIPIAVAGELDSDPGGPRLISGTGEVAGIRTGPLVEVIAAAVITQL
jgi:hypothetical protein